MAALEKQEMDALKALVQIVPTTVAGYRAVAQHLVRYAPLETRPEGVADRLLRAFAADQQVR